MELLSFEKEAGQHELEGEERLQRAGRLKEQGNQLYKQVGGVWWWWCWWAGVWGWGGWGGWGGGGAGWGGAGWGGGGVGGGRGGAADSVLCLLAVCCCGTASRAWRRVGFHPTMSQSAGCPAAFCTLRSHDTCACMARVRTSPARLERVPFTLATSSPPPGAGQDQAGAHQVPQGAQAGGPRV